MTASEIADLIAAHAAALVLFARQWCDSPEDAVQNAFCNLVQLRTPPADPVAYLFKAVRYAASTGAAARRRVRRETAAARPARWFLEPEVEGLDAAAAVAALEALPPDQREAIVGRLWGGMTLEQLAAVAGCSVTTAHRRYRDNLMRWANLPLWQIPAEALNLKPQPGVFVELAPAFNKVKQAQARVQQRIDVQRIVEAIRAYAAEHDGKLPESLEATKLPMPVDSISGKPYQYSVKDGKAMVRGAVPPDRANDRAFNRVVEITIRK